MEADAPAAESAAAGVPVRPRASVHTPSTRICIFAWTLALIHPEHAGRSVSRELAWGPGLPPYTHTTRQLIYLECARVHTSCICFDRVVRQQDSYLDRKCTLNFEG